MAKGNFILTPPLHNMNILFHYIITMLVICVCINMQYMLVFFCVFVFMYACVCDLCACVCLCICVFMCVCSCVCVCVCVCVCQFPPSEFSLSALNRTCQQMFGVSPRPAWLPDSMGMVGDLLKITTRIIFSNGLLDPWCWYRLVQGLRLTVGVRGEVG